MTNENVKRTMTPAKRGLSIILHSLLLIISILTDLTDNFDKITLYKREI